MNPFISRKPPIRYSYIYIAALLFSIVVLIQTSKSGIEGAFVIELQYIVFYSINYLVWAVLINWVYGLTKLLDNIIKHKTFTLILTLLIAVICMVCVHLIISNIFYYAYFFITIKAFTIDQALVSFSNAIIPSIASRLVDLLIILLILKIIDAFQTVQKRNLQLAKLENLLHVSELQSLKAQLQPHFLFNALHAMHTLIGHDDIKAKSMVIKMSSLLRKMLDHRDKEVVSFEEELNYLKDYSEIEEERFHDRLSVHFNIEEATKKILVPVLMLQPLAENAFKHGISLVEGASVIHVSSKIVGDDLIIEMSNTIPLEDQTNTVQSTKFGLKNLEERLQQLYGDSYTFKTEKKEGIFKVLIIIKTTLKA